MIKQKFCIFCGKKPEGKTKEHVLPKWLIEMTGGKKRTANFGINKAFSPEKIHRQFSFKQFVFPACDNCNNFYSALEEKIKPILIDILQEKEISSFQLSLFMDWLDKIRVGLWLGMMQLDENYLETAPKFHISSRIGQADRLLIIEKTDGKTEKLNFGGVDCPSFSLTPSAFTLIVNNYYFTNVSMPFLFSARLGFPFPQNVYVSPDRDALECNFSHGRERIMLPLLRRNLTDKGIRIYQPMFKNGQLSENTQHYYSGDYVKAHSMDIKNGLGNIFIDKNNRLSEYQKNDSLLLQPDEIQDDEELFIKSAINVNQWQNWLSSQMPSLEKLSYEQKKFVKSRFRMAKEVNDIFINHHEDVLARYKASKDFTKT